MRQITKDQAIEFYNSECWKNFTDIQIVDFQLFQKHLAVPLRVFHNALENVLKRPVWMRELSNKKKLIEEYKKKFGNPQSALLLDVIFKYKRKP